MQTRHAGIVAAREEDLRQVSEDQDASIAEGDAKVSACEGEIERAVKEREEESHEYMNSEEYETDLTWLMRRASTKLAEKQVEVIGKYGGLLSRSQREGRQQASTVQVFMIAENRTGSKTTKIGSGLVAAAQSSNPKCAKCLSDNHSIGQCPNEWADEGQGCYAFGSSAVSIGKRKLSTPKSAGNSCDQRNGQ